MSLQDKSSGCQESKSTIESNFHIPQQVNHTHFVLNMCFVLNMHFMFNTQLELNILNMWQKRQIHTCTFTLAYSHPCTHTVTHSLKLTHAPMHTRIDPHTHTCKYKPCTSNIRFLSKNWFCMNTLGPTKSRVNFLLLKNFVSSYAFRHVLI